MVKKSFGAKAEPDPKVRLISFGGRLFARDKRVRLPKPSEGMPSGSRFLPTIGTRAPR